MEWLILGPAFLVGFAIWWGCQTALLRVVARAAASSEIGWAMAAVSVVAASGTQGCVMGAVFGGDAGCFGTVVGWAMWSGVLSLLNGLPFARALLVGACMAVVNWVIVVLMIGLAVWLGLGLLLAAA